MIQYYDLKASKKTEDISTLFPAWKAEDERIVVLSPHDDDGLLGAGYAILAAIAAKAEVFVLVFCKGQGGYSRPEDKQDIVARRKKETVSAYGEIGVKAENIIRFDYPDFSLASHIGWQLPGGKTGTFAGTISKLRELRATRLLVPNGYREHADHEAVWKIGVYDGPQAGDAVVADWGEAAPVKSYLEYSVWGEFSPERPADRAIKLPWDEELKIQEGLARWESQGEVIKGLLAARKGRRTGDCGVEIYRSLETRVPLDYGPYRDQIEKIDT